eukprot:TRINITY_DN1814_c0_g1_i1.p1 TRINITY_DN1814_c0_g1~~TRINITY_DN1814_c0_g1_i1.p1  ORF type:complete len:142 (-),score=2.15 TRINITY_DN1814_c0_g1_i1:110-535(-)
MNEIEKDTTGATQRAQSRTPVAYCEHKTLVTKQWNIHSTRVPLWFQTGKIILMDHQRGIFLCSSSYVEFGKECKREEKPSAKHAHTKKEMAKEYAQSSTTQSTHGRSHGAYNLPAHTVSKRCNKQRETNKGRGLSRNLVFV